MLEAVHTSLSEHYNILLLQDRDTIWRYSNYIIESPDRMSQSLGTLALFQCIWLILLKSIFVCTFIFIKILLCPHFLWKLILFLVAFETLEELLFYSLHPFMQMHPIGINLFHLLAQDTMYVCIFMVSTADSIYCWTFIICYLEANNDNIMN